MTRILGALSGSAIALAVAAAAFTVAVGLPSGDPDMWWHLASGRWMVEHRDGLRVDVFSSTATGEPYALGEWLGEVVLYLAYAAGSWLGVAILRAALVALAAFAVARLALRAAPARVAIPLAVLALLLSKATWTDRPQLFTLAFVPLILELCLAARSGSRPALIAAIPLVAVWANLHGGYALGIAIMWVFALEALLQRRPALPQLAAAAVATIVVGSEPGALPFVRAIGHVAGSSIRIVEESPADPLTPFGALFALFVGMTIAVLMLRGGSLLAALLLMPILWLALSAQRHVPLFGFVAVPFIAGPLTQVLDEMGTTLRRGVGRVRRSATSPGPGSSSEPFPDLNQFGPRSHQFGSTSAGPLEEHPEAGTRSLLDMHVDPHQIDRTSHQSSLRGAARPSSKSSQGGRPALPLAAALWLGALVSIPSADPRPDLRPYPDGARAALAATSGVLFNEYDWGGYLIWTVPGRPVFVDGRLYPFAGNGVMGAYQEAIHVLPSWRSVIERWNVAQALIRPEGALTQALRDEGWTVRVQGEGFVLLERPR